MPRNRVLSFMSQWGSHSPESGSGANTPPKTTANHGRVVPVLDTAAAARASTSYIDSSARQSSPPQSASTPSRARGESRTGGRPLSMIQTYQAPQVEVARDTPPELQPIFGFLNSHGNKLYQEGYFLKLHDLDARGRPSADRSWVECFAQLVGTVLSLWDAAALDAAGVDGEVVPTFINLSDASLKMIESLPMSGAQGGKLQNVLSISTAANNRYLLHFNSLNSLTQWTAGIRLAMFEHATLQEAYTGSLVAGKGRFLNNIRAIMERSRFPTEDWARVRFGAGTPWRRLWFVITPPDDKEYHKAKKMVSKGATYLRSQLPRGDIKFYDTRKVTKKTKPIATINDVYAAYAIYPQSTPLIEQSTLVKMEGLVTIHSSPETTAEGFVFIMPEVHPAVSGFEMLLRWLFPVWDTFNLYGRPNKLIADTLDQRGLMFAMPRDRRYGYLDILDVSGLIHESGSQAWSERQWRKQMKKLTADRMNARIDPTGIYGHRRSVTGSQASLPSASRGVRFNDGDSTHSTPSRSASPAPGGILAPPKRVDSAPPSQHSSPHKRSASDAQGYKRYQAETPSRLSQEMNRREDYAPMPPRHASPVSKPQGPGMLQRIESGLETPTMASLQSGLHPTTDPVDVPPEPVNTPPAFTHNPGSRPANSPAVAPELRRAQSGVDAATLSQMQDAASAQGTEDDYGNLVTHTVDDNTYRNTGRSYADRSKGPFEPILPIRKLPGQQAMGAIPDSPRVPDGFSAGDKRVQPTNTSLPNMLNEQRPPLPLSRSSHSITRKPVPRKAVTEAASSTGTPSPVNESFTGAYIDNDALERVLQEDARLNSMGSIASSATPDYASTTSGASKQGKKQSIERPRMGQLKTVGALDMMSIDNRAGKLDTWRSDQQAAAAAIPTVDFGPTRSYKPTVRPDTGSTVMPGDRSRPSSRDRLSGYLPISNRASPGDTGRNSYFGGDTNLVQPGNRHSVAWTPGAGGSPSSGAGLTPEQWVQYRAAMASQPQPAPRSSASALSHSRQNSTPTVPRKLTKPPPFARKSSGDWSQLGRRTPPSRPNSRGASTYFGQPSPNSTQNLSAVEQMHVARATGTPLLDMLDPRQIQEHNAPNLLNAVAMREREKAAVKEGMRNGMVEEAIRSRQQQQMQNNAESLRQHATLVQQQGQQAAQARQFQQNAYARSNMPSNASPSLYQVHRQSWIQPQQQQQLSAGYHDVGPAPVYDNQLGFSSPFSQRLYEGQQSQAFMAQQGQAHRHSPGPGYG